MISRRAKGWLHRTALALVMLSVVVLAGASWHYSNRIRSELLEAEPSSPSYELEVLDVGDETVTLRRTAESARPGIWGLEWPGGYAQLGDVVTISETTVVRTVSLLEGRLTPRTLADIDGFAFRGGPEARDLSFEEVTYENSLGKFPAWFIDGSDDTWVIFVHGRGSGLDEALRMLSTVAEMGFPALVITYRNDPGAPATASGHYGLGSSEWKDLEAAALYALEERGAQDLVLVGFSMGGSIISIFLHDSPQADRVGGVIFDAPLLDVGVAVDNGAEDRGVPGFITGWAKGLASLRFGINWSRLDQVKRAQEFDVPILLFHGTEDDKVPIRSSDDFAEARPDLVTYERVEGAGHVQAWNVDPVRYEEAVRDFLAPVAEGAAGASTQQ